MLIQSLQSQRRQILGRRIAISFQDQRGHIDGAASYQGLEYRPTGSGTQCFRLGPKPNGRFADFLQVAFNGSIVFMSSLKTLKLMPWTWLSMRSIDCKMSLKHCAGLLKDKLGLTVEIAAHVIFQSVAIGKIDLDS